MSAAQSPVSAQSNGQHWHSSSTDKTFTFRSSFLVKKRRQKSEFHFERGGNKKKRDGVSSAISRFPLAIWLWSHVDDGPTGSRCDTLNATWNGANRPKRWLFHLADASQGASVENAISNESVAEYPFRASLINNDACLFGRVAMVTRFITHLWPRRRSSNASTGKSEHVYCESILQGRRLRWERAQNVHWNQMR